MRHLPFYLLVLLLLPFSLSVSGAPAKRPAGKQSTLPSVRKEQKLVLKPLVYNPKTNRPVMAKKPRWWQKR